MKTLSEMDAVAHMAVKQVMEAYTCYDGVSSALPTAAYSCTAPLCRLSFRPDVAALYIDPRGPSPALPGVDCWDEKRDGRLYNGPFPVVAHPPCGPWGRLSGLCRYQDRAIAPLAVEQVRSYGGILEHPAHSRLWDACRMPPPVIDCSAGRKGQGLHHVPKSKRHITPPEFAMWLVDLARGIKSEC